MATDDEDVNVSSGVDENVVVGIAVVLVGVVSDVDSTTVNQNTFMAHVDMLQKLANYFKHTPCLMPASNNVLSLIISSVHLKILHPNI